MKVNISNIYKLQMNKDFDFDFAEFDKKDADQKLVGNQLKSLLDECGVG